MTRAALIRVGVTLMVLSAGCEHSGPAAPPSPGAGPAAAETCEVQWRAFKGGPLSPGRVKCRRTSSHLLASIVINRAYACGGAMWKIYNGDPARGHLLDGKRAFASCLKGQRCDFIYKTNGRWRSYKDLTLCICLKKNGRWCPDRTHDMSCAKCKWPPRAHSQPSTTTAVQP
jgi:hypothetical protein